MALSKKGIMKLADALVAHQERYDQSSFGEVETCGTVCCLAGFCLIEEVGLRRFNHILKKTHDLSCVVDDVVGFEDACDAAGKRQLGLPIRGFPQIFRSIDSWPRRLEDVYYSNVPRARVIAALMALECLTPNGKIGARVVTPLPQLKKLLASKKGAHAKA